ncbi:MAG: bifunctional DNA primase/polymerase, partial [Proteobacteria bacterium]|nr:bifunctional DNA primase/polymerase [Pseudomonadota bacterium]
MTTSEPPADAQDTAETQRAGVKMLTAALAYAKRGWPIFPCRPGTKVPLTKNGVLNATTNPQQIDKWWTATPDANIGLDVGGANMLALDYDPGFNLEVLENNVGPIPKTGLRCRTPRGGQHCYLTIGVDECVPASTSKLAPHVDVRSFHSYTLLPPSKTKDGSYTWIEDGPPAWRSERIFQATATGRSKSEDRDEWTIEPDLDENIALATKWLQSDAKVAVEGQGGDHCAYATAAMMKSYGLSPELALELMLENWNPRCNPPW